MVTVHREAGLRFVIYANDHEPAHVHVQGDGTIKVAIRGASGLPEIIEAVGIKTGDRRRAMDVIRERQDEFLAHWSAIQERRQ
jgi:hypothetical protein